MKKHKQVSYKFIFSSIIIRFFYTTVFNYFYQYTSYKLKHTLNVKEKHVINK